MSKYMEIKVNGEIYKLVAGFGFLHEVNKKVTVDVPNTGKKKEVGLKFMVALKILLHYVLCYHFLHQNYEQ